MSVKIDWIAFTLPAAFPLRWQGEGGRLDIAQAARDEFPHAFDYVSNFTDFKLLGGNKIFTHNFRSETGDISVSQSTRQPLCRIEVSGQGMKLLHENMIIKKWLKYYWDRMTRIDLCSDFATNFSPQEIAAGKEDNRFEAYADIHTGSGDSFYIGSYKSDRFAYIYRYSKPHPRAGMLRIEIRHKKEYAKALAYELLAFHPVKIYNGLLQTFGITNFCGFPIKAGRKFTVAGHVSSMAGTERWLFKQVLPAIRKLADAGQTQQARLFLLEAKRLIDNAEIKYDNEYQRLLERMDE